MTYNRRTLASEAVFEGLGLHSGEPVVVTVHPSAEGIAFRFGTTRVQARPENVTDTTRCTRLGEVGTIEHVMAAFAGLGITDAEVELSAGEMPGLDGSASPYVRGLSLSGFQEIGEAEAHVPYSRVFLQEERVKIAISSGEGLWRYEFEIDDRWPGKMSYETAKIELDFEGQVAPARTFALVEEVPAILQAGLARGLDETSALILGIEGYKNDARFPDEPARHKLLDLIGDLYLAGIPVQFLNVVSERSGHASNVRAAALLANAVATP